MLAFKAEEGAISVSPNPVSTQARGLARRWLADCAVRYRAMLAVIQRPGVARLAAEVMRVRDRPRARYTLRKLLDPYADFVATLDRPPLLIWRALQPGIKLHAMPTNNRDRQEYLGVMAVAIGAAARQQDRLVLASVALWGVAVSHHGLRRLHERSPGTDATAAVLAAHSAVLAGSSVHARTAGSKLLIPVALGGGGVFVGRLVRATLAEQPAGLLVVISTFVAHDMLYLDQESMLLPPASDHRDKLAMLPLTWREEARSR